MHPVRKFAQKPDNHGKRMVDCALFALKIGLFQRLDLTRTIFFMYFHMFLTLQIKTKNINKNKFCRLLFR